MLAYWKRVILRAHHDTLLLLGVGSTTRGRVLASLLIYIVAVLIIGILGGRTEMGGEARWALAIILATLVMYVPFFLYHLAAAPARFEAAGEQHAHHLLTGVQQDLNTAREELDRLLSRELRIVFGEGHPFEQWGPGVFHGFRVGIEDLGGQTIEDVHVELVAIDPPENAYVPIVLHLKGNDQPQETKFRFPLDPGEREYVDVVWNYDDPANRRFWLFYADRDKPSEMPAKPYPHTITLRALGRNVVKSQERRFVIRVDEGGRLHFHPE